MLFNFCIMMKRCFCVLSLLLALGLPVAAQSQADDLAYFKERVKTLGSDEFGEQPGGGHRDHCLYLSKGGE